MRISTLARGVFLVLVGGSFVAVLLQSMISNYNKKKLVRVERSVGRTLRGKDRVGGTKMKGTGKNPSRLSRNSLAPSSSLPLSSPSLLPSSSLTASPTTFLSRYSSFNLPSSSISSSSNKHIITASRRPRLADGCNSVYLDLGANRGGQVRRVFEPEKFPYSKTTAYLTKVLGPPQDRKLPGAVCVFGFEPNPFRFPQLQELEDCYNKKGWRVMFFPLAISNTGDNKLSFYLDMTGGDQHELTSKRMNENQTRIEVDAIDIGDFVLNEIADRDLGPVYAGSWNATVYAKWDIEGGEYYGLASLLIKGVICHMTVSRVEWHRNLMEVGDGAVHGGAFHTAKEYQDFHLLFTKLMNYKSRFLGCKRMKLRDLDDQEY